MPLVSSLRWISQAVALYIAISNAQNCYYPDGKTLSTDTPCNSTATTASSCCSSDQFCLVGGLCFGGGIVSRGSCTDATWSSEACAGFCKTVDGDSQVAITPCTSDIGSNIFTCGVNTTGCQTQANTFSFPDDISFLLRPAQVAALVKPALAAEQSSLATPTDSAGLFTAGQLAGVACGIAAPALIAVAILIVLLRRERRRFTKPKLMYKLPDECNEDFRFRPTTSAAGSRPDLPILTSTESFNSPSPASTTRARAPSMRSRGNGRPPGNMPSFVERYEAMKYNVQVQERERHELDTTPPPNVERFELGVRRMS